MLQRSVKSYLYEGMVIVASILVAFALDASWSNYQESKVERRVLGELKEELESASARIEISMIELESAVEGSLELAGNLGKDTSALSPNAAQNLVIWALSMNTLEVPTSVVDSIIASGQVRLISKSELRDALAKWPSFIADVRENHEWHRVETDEYLIPYFAQFLSIRDTLISGGALRTLTASTFDYEVVPMQRDEVFEDRLAWRIMRLQATLYETNVLLDESGKLLALINAELD
jgi:hypothetical protein